MLRSRSAAAAVTPFAVSLIGMIDKEMHTLLIVDHVKLMLADSLEVHKSGRHQPFRGVVNANGLFYCI